MQGANLYEANLGAPISHVDPYGMTSEPTTRPTTDPSGTQPTLVPGAPSNAPYVLRDLGGADQHGDVTWGETDCHIDVSVSVVRGTGSSFRVKAQVAVYQQIVINSKIVQIGKRIDGTYGHEQRHVQDGIDFGKELQDEANKATKASGSMNLAQAEDFAENLKTLLQHRAESYNDRESNHKNPNGPAKGRDYPIIGTMPLRAASRPTTQPGVSPL